MQGYGGDPPKVGGENWIGRNAAVQWARSQLWEVAQTDLPVLICGEPGTGRGLAARLIHELGRRASGPFVRFDCVAPAIPVETSGSFAPVDEARGGTLFLDEVGCLPVTWQESLLPALREQGPGMGSAAVDGRWPRLVAGTGQDLGQLVRAGRFTDEVRHRLAVVQVDLPPLRDRRGDIPLLARYFVAGCAARMGRPRPVLTHPAMVALLGYGWPGNVWELKRVLERAVVLAASGRIGPEHLVRPQQEGGCGYLLGLTASRAGD
ncbi:MAG: sigma 54-interacting transcriptional regulator [Candidatus Latescibacterota bacterium]|jgi:DNA-binding NtrC family response regulator